MSKATVTELEVRFTADTQQVETAAKKVKDQAEKIEKSPVEMQVDGDATDALAAMGRVEAEAKKIVSAKTMATVDANIDKAETSLEKVSERLEYLHSVEATMEVTADIKRAESALQQITRRRDALVAAKETMKVDADVSPAEAELEGLADTAADAGAEGGSEAGSNLVTGIVAGLASIPIAGAVVQIGKSIGDAVVQGFTDGLQVEVQQDRLQALTGLDEPTAAKFARAAAESYADVFGESIEANMDTARLALQFDLIDEDATAREAEDVISSLAGIADVLGEDVQPVAQAVTTMLRTGIVDSAEEAFDVLATGAREGVNAAEDLLDTFIEYPALFERLGLDADEALGLLNQGLEGGARNADLVADALKEFQIRATDASEASAEGFEAIGLNAEEMTAKIAAGGDGAKEGLDQVLDGLRAMEDPVARNAAGVALFGTQWEDMGDAMLALDLSTAVDQLNGVSGAAQTMFATLSDNDATKMEEAKRNIEVAVQGIQGALATVFAEPLGEFASWVSKNRGPLLEFLLSLANGALDFGRSAIEAGASAVEGFGAFVAETGPGILNMINGIVQGLGTIGLISDEEAQNFQDFTDSSITNMESFADSTSDAADDIRNTLIPPLDDAQERLNDFGSNQVNLGHYHDASLRLAEAIGTVGVAADGSAISMADLDTTNLSTTASGQQLESQILAAVDALDAEAAAGANAGETQASLTERYNQGREALIQQLEQMGLSREEAIALADAYGAVPGKVETILSNNAADAEGKVTNYTGAFSKIPSSTSTTVNAETESASNKLQGIINKINAIPGSKTVSVTAISKNATGGVLETFATGGLRPMSPIAQMVPPNTWRVVGDRQRDDEAYIPLDGSARSWSILMEAFRRMPGVAPMADGGVNSTGSRSGASRVQAPLTVMVGDRALADLVVDVVGDVIRVRNRTVAV